MWGKIISPFNRGLCPNNHPSSNESSGFFTPKWSMFTVSQSGNWESIATHNYQEQTREVFMRYEAERRDMSRVETKRLFHNLRSKTMILVTLNIPRTTGGPIQIANARAITKYGSLLGEPLYSAYAFLLSPRLLAHFNFLLCSA